MLRIVAVKIQVAAQIADGHAMGVFPQQIVIGMCQQHIVDFALDKGDIAIAAADLDGRTMLDDLALQTSFCWRNLSLLCHDYPLKQIGGRMVEALHLFGEYLEACLLSNLFS